MDSIVKDTIEAVAPMVAQAAQTAVMPCHQTGMTITVSPVLALALLAVIAALGVLCIVAIISARSLQLAVETLAANGIPSGSAPAAQHQASAVAAPVPQQQNLPVTPELLAVITAAISSTLGEDASNIRIQEISSQGQSWRSQGRSQLQSNHQPHSH